MQFYDFVKDVKNTIKDKICIFRIGTFFNAVGIDAVILSEYTDLIKVCFGNNVCKCGVPINIIDRFIDKLIELDLPFCIFDYTEDESNYSFKYKDKIYSCIKENKGVKINFSKYSIDCTSCKYSNNNLLSRLNNIENMLIKLLSSK